MGEYPGHWRDPQLGLTRLDARDQEELITLNDTGTVATVEILCDQCLPVPGDQKLWYN